MVNLLKSTKSIVSKNMGANFLSGKFAALHKNIDVLYIHQHFIAQSNYDVTQKYLHHVP